MSLSKIPVNMFCKVSWLCLVALALLMLGFAFHRGLHIDTSISALMPIETQDLERTNALATVRDMADRRVTLLLKSDNQQQLEAAVEAAKQAIEQAPKLVSLVPQGQLPESALALFKEKRFFLLSEDDREQLRIGDLQGFKQKKLTDLYGGTAQLNVLDFEADPFNTLGAYLEPRLQANLLPPSNLQYVLTLRLSDRFGEAKTQAALATLFDAMRADLQTNYPEVTLYRSAVFFFAQHSASDAKRDINFISAGSLLAMLILLLLVFRSVWPLAVPLASILVGVVVAFSVVHTVFSSVHVLTIVFGASLIGIVIDYSIHFYFHCTHPSASSQLETGRNTISPALMRALLISLLSSVIGYAALALSGLELLQRVAVFSVCGVIASWLTVITWAPQTVKRTSVAVVSLLSKASESLQSFAKKVSQAVSLALWLAALACAVVLIGLLAKGQDDPRLFIKMPAHLLAENDTVAQAIAAPQTGRYLLVRAATEQALFDRLKDLEARVTNAQELLSVLDWLPAPQQQLENYKMSAALYNDGGLAKQFMSELGLPDSAAQVPALAYRKTPATPLSAIELFGPDQIALPALVYRSDSNYYAYVFFKRGAAAAEFEKVAASLNAITSIDDIEYVDSVAASTQILAKQRHSAILMLLLAYVVMAALLLFVYRQSQAVLLLLIPGSATVVAVLILAMLGQAFTLFHTMALFLVLGLGMDYAVFLAEMRDNRHVTLQAVLLSALTSMLSFGFLALSRIPVAQAFGLTVFLGSTMNLFFSFVFVHVISRRKAQRLEQGC